MSLSFARKRLVLIVVFAVCAVIAFAKFGPASKAGVEPEPSSASEPKVGAVFAPSIAATLTDNVTAATKAAPGGTINYTATINNTAGAGNDATNVLYSDILDANTALVPGTVTMSPLAVADSYTTAIINAPFTINAPGVLANDSGLPAPTVVPSSGPTTGGGTVTRNANGSFTYTPANNFTGIDTFTYTATNGQAAPNPGVDDVAIVSINVDPPPSLILLDPAHLTSNVPTTKIITYTFSEPVTLAPGALRLDCPANVEKPGTISPVGPATVYTLTPNTPLVEGANCTANAFFNLITDSAGQQLVYPNPATNNNTSSFIVNTFPTVQSTIPDNNATAVTINSQITVFFTELVNVGAGAFTFECPAATPIPFTVNPTLPNGTAASAFFLTPNSNLPSNTVCTVKVFAAQVQDPSGEKMAADHSFSFTTGTPPAITSANATTFTVGKAGTFSVTTTGSPTINNLSMASVVPGPGGTLPNGVTYNYTSGPDGTLAGTPSNASQVGTYKVSFTATNGNPPDAVQNPFTLNVVCPAITLAPANNSTFTGDVDIPFSQVFTPAGGNGTYTYTLGGAALPNIAFSGNDLNGTPNASGSFAFTVQATDATGCTSPVQNYTLNIAAAPVNNPPTVFLDGVPDGLVLPDGVDHAAAYTTGNAAGVAISDVDGTVDDPDAVGINSQIASLDAVLTDPHSGELELLNITSAGHTIATNNGLTITGENTSNLNVAGSAADTAYQDLLREIRYINNDTSVATNLADRHVTVQVQDGPGANSNIPTATVSLTRGNHDPVITSDGGGDNASKSINEGDTAVTTVNATDADAGTSFSYSIVPGNDGGLFSIDGSGNLAFGSPPNFETPGDGDSNNSYVVEVKVSDGVTFDTQLITVTVGDVAPNAPIDNNGAANSVIAGAATGTTVGVTAFSTDVAGGPLFYSIVADDSNGGFQINSSSGIVTVLNGAQIVSPGPYHITVRADDGTLPSVADTVFTIDVIEQETRHEPTEVRAGPNADDQGWGTLAFVSEVAGKIANAIVPTVYSRETTPGEAATHPLKGRELNNAPLSGELICIDGDPDIDVGTCTGPGFTLPAGKSVNIKYQATVNAPPMSRSLTTQGLVTANGGISVQTDDPEPGGASDLTVTLVDTLMTWNGVTNTDWNTATNWTPPAGGASYAPGVSNPAINDVVIPNVGNQPNIGATDIGVYSLNIANGRTLAITSGRVLTIGGSPGGDLTLDGIISGGNLNLGTGSHSIFNAGGTGSLVSTNAATVLSGSNVTLSNNLQAGALAVNPGGSMNITNRTLSLNGSGVALAVPGGAALTTTGSTVVYNGTAAQSAAGIAYNNLTINNSIGVHVTGVTLTGNATVNGALALASSDLNTGAFTLTQPNTTASTGVSDVIGSLTRTAAFGTTTITFGNPNNQITFVPAGTKPASLTVLLAKSPPATFPTAVQRSYNITATGAFTSAASLRLHYRDAELNGNSELPDSNFNLFKGPAWTPVVPSNRNTGPGVPEDNWLESNNVTSFSEWTMASSKADTSTAITNAAALASASGIGTPYPVTWSVTVTPPRSGTPTGDVSVTDGTDTCTAPVATGSCDLISTTTGDKTITASYLGDLSFNASTSPGVPHTVVGNLSGNIQQFAALAANAPETNTPLAGVTVTLAGPGVHPPVMTDANGNYVFSNLTGGGNYTVTPSGLGYTYDPISRTYNNFNANITNADFVAYTGAVPRVLSVANSYTFAGQPANVRINLASMGTEKTISFSLNFDQNLIALPVVTCGTSDPGCIIATDTTQPGKIGITVTPATQLAAGSRNIAVVTFQTFAIEPSNTPVTIGPAPTPKLITNANGDPLPAAFTNGFVIFGSGYEGDVAGRPNGSGEAPPANSVNTSDITQVALFVAGTNTAGDQNTNEFQRADSAPSGLKGDGAINSSDVVQVARFAAGLDGAPPAGAGVLAGGPFGPQPAPPPLTRPSGSDGDRGQARAKRTMRVVSTTASPGGDVAVTVELDSRGDEVASSFTLNFDAASLRISDVSSPETNPDVNVGSDAPAGTGVVVNAAKAARGQVGIVVFNSSLMPFANATGQKIVTLHFRVAEDALNGASPITFGDSENTPTKRSMSDGNANPLNVTYIEGEVNIVGTNPTGVSISGRVLTADGNGIGQAVVVMTDSQGTSCQIVTGSFGVFRFNDVSVGETYVISVSSKRFRFTSQTVTAGSDLADVTFMADPGGL